MEDFDISIMIGCFMQERFLDEAYWSAKNQIVADNVHIDVIIQHDNCASGRPIGVTRFRNYHVPMLRGKWVILLDADDRLPVNYVQALVDAADAMAVPEVVGCPIQFISGPRLERFGSIPDGRYRLADERTLQSIPISAMFRKQDFDACGGFDIDRPVLDDWYFYARMLSLPGARYTHTNATCLLKNNLGNTLSHRATQQDRNSCIDELNQKYGLNLPYSEII